MIVIANADKPLNAIELSEKMGFSKHHIGKVMQRLVKCGYLRSSRGPTGGFIANSDPAKVTLYDIYKCIEGEIEAEPCPHDSRICPYNKCIRSELVSRLSDDVVTFLSSRTLQEYL